MSCTPSPRKALRSHHEAVHAPQSCGRCTEGSACVFTTALVVPVSLYMVARRLFHHSQYFWFVQAVNIYAGIQGCEVLHEAHEMMVRMTAIVHAAHLANGVHG